MTIGDTLFRPCSRTDGGYRSCVPRFKNWNGLMKYIHKGETSKVFFGGSTLAIDLSLRFVLFIVIVLSALGS